MFEQIINQIDPNYIMKKLDRKYIFLLIAVLSFMLLSSCENKEVIDSCLTGKTYGFWAGLWHGIIAPIDLVIMLFNDKVTVFAQNNTGFWYAFGFILGSGGWGFLGSKGAKRRKKYD